MKKNEDTRDPDHRNEFKVITKFGNERLAKGSIYVKEYDGEYKWYNYKIEINPPNFDPHHLVKGRSLLDNLFSEHGINKHDLTDKLLKGGGAWINAIQEVHRSGLSLAKRYTKKLWTDGKNAYDDPTRIYTTDKMIDLYGWSG